MNKAHSAIPPVDLRSLHSLRLVAHFRNITAAAESLGITQSALTRQIQSAEHNLGIQIFERTTRSLKITEAGAVFLRETEPIANILDGAVRRINEDYLGATKTLRIGVSRSLSISHFPGLFHAQQRLYPEVKISVSQPTSKTLVQAVDSCQLDLAILTRPAVLPKSIAVKHSIRDELCLIVGKEFEPPVDLENADSFRQWATAQQWILPPQNSSTRELISQWSKEQQYDIHAHTELDSFDVMMQLVALNMGVAFVPKRSLSSFPRKQSTRRLTLPTALERELIVITSNRPNSPPHVQEFVSSILFS